MQRQRWCRRAASWNEQAESNPGLSAVAAVVLATARPRGCDRAVDLGAGTGLVTLPLARLAGAVLAVDISPTMIELLRENLWASGLANVDCRVEALERLALPSGSVDVIVSNYALHHLEDSEKVRLLRAAAAWLRAGGRLVVGDLMLGRGGDPRDRAIIAAKVRTLLRRGPGGVWRILKNAWRFTLRTSERPLSPAAWAALLSDAGFTEVRQEIVIAEGAVVSGVLPGGAER